MCAAASRPPRHRHSTTTQAPPHTSPNALPSDDSTNDSPQHILSSTPRTLHFEDEDPIHVKSNRIIAHQSYVKAIYDLAAGPNGSQALLQLLKKRLPRSLLIRREEDIPSEPLDETRLRRVQALEYDIRLLGRRVQQARNRYMPHLHTSIQQRVEHIAKIPVVPGEKSKPIVMPNIDKEEVRRSKNVLGVAVKTIVKLQQRAADTKKRAASVREVLKIIDANSKQEQDHGNVSQTIVADWSESYEHLKQTKRKSSNNSHVSSHMLPSPVPRLPSAPITTTSPRKSPSTAHTGSRSRRHHLNGSGARSKSPFRGLPR